MSLTNNTKFRRKNLVITRKINDVVDTAGGFPVTVSILSGFTDPTGGQVYPAITEQNLAVMTDVQYNTRLNAFYNYLENLYPIFNRTSVGNASFGTDAVLCPLDNSAPASPTLLSAIAELITPTGMFGNPAYLNWTIALDAQYPFSIQFTGIVEVRSRNNFIVSQIPVIGVIPPNISLYDHYLVTAEQIYVPEALDPLHEPVTVAFAPGTFNLVV